MKFTVEYPVSASGYHRDLVTGAGMERVVRAAEECGFDAIAFTEHPAPSLKWLEAGGHESLDPLAALSFCAAVSQRLKLMTYLLVLPYHNPFALAKALTTVDLLSGGRAIVVAGTGYLRSEFRALNLDIEERNERFDESIEVMRGAWTQVPYDHEGRHFRGVGVAQLPMPTTAGGPAIFIGGNSAKARRRAARNHGWSPLMIDERLAATTRTQAISTVKELAAAIAMVRAMAAAEQGEGAAIEVQVHTPSASSAFTGSVAEHRDLLGRLAEAGVDRFVLQPDGPSVSAVEDALRGYADTYRDAFA